MKELENLVEELKTDAVKKDTRLDNLQKRSDKLYTFLGEAKGAAVKEFKASSEFTDILDRQYAAGFKDFYMNAMKCFLEVDFSPIKLNIAAGSSFFQTSSKDVKIEDDASTQLVNDDPKPGVNSPQ